MDDLHDPFRARLEALRAACPAANAEALRIARKMRMPEHLWVVFTSVFETQVVERFDVLEELLLTPEENFTEEMAMACESEMDAIEEVLTRQGKLIAEGKDWIQRN